MNIIEAFQHAENGNLITNNYLKIIGNGFLLYRGNGTFQRYELINNKPKYKYEVRGFDYAEIISNSWEILDKTKDELFR